MADTTKQTLYTPEGYRELENELNYLKYTKREEVKEQIAVARSYGDLSENSEYDEARNEQAKTEARIKELEELIAHAVIIDEESIERCRMDQIQRNGGTRKILMKELIYIVEDDEELEYNIVGSNEANPREMRISDQSPIGKGLMGSRAGETITIEVPNPNSIVILGPDKQKVGQFAAEVREKRLPEPYKGKGIRYADEVVRIKEAKKK